MSHFSDKIDSLLRGTRKTEDEVSEIKMHVEQLEARFEERIKQLFSMVERSNEILKKLVVLEGKSIFFFKILAVFFVSKLSEKVTLLGCVADGKTSDSETETSLVRASVVREFSPEGRSTSASSFSVDWTSGTEVRTSPPSVETF